MSQISKVGPVLPFDPQVPPERAFEYAGRQQARRTVLEALAAGWHAAIIGESGAGKTLLLRDLERLLRAGGLDVRLGGPGEAAPRPVGHGTVRLVDSADALDDTALRLLVLAGGMTVLAVLPPAAPRVRNLPVRVAAVGLPPLCPAEVEEFVASTLAEAGNPPDLFDAAAVAALASLSGGLPHQLNVLGRASLLRARRDGSPRVEARHVEAAAEAERRGNDADGTSTMAQADPVVLRRSPPQGALAVAARRSSSAPWWRRQAPLLVLPVLPLALALAGWFVFPRALHLSGEEYGRAPSEGAAPALVATPTTGAAPATAAGTAAPIPRDPSPEVDRSRAASPLATDPAQPGRAAVHLGGGEAPSKPGTFHGTTFNETLGRSGVLRIAVNRAGPGDLVTVRFAAHGGLIGAGQLAGRLSRDGRLVASGTLMMGRNPFATELEGTISGDVLTGTARYTRIIEPGVRLGSTRGSFRLNRG
ncbi:MAG: hypothetical protein K2X49_00965 [Acetobacteraceae bacterium]|nr:hypothetical protein [Acetobacteraceae bacterium]